MQTGDALMTNIVRLGSQTDPINIWIFIMILLWLICLIWVGKDASHRYRDLRGQVYAIVIITVLTPIIWLPLYLASRPYYTKKDRLAWREQIDLLTVPCYKCLTINLHHHSHCINCGTSLQTTCKQCKTKYPYDHRYCNNCWDPILNV